MADHVHYTAKVSVCIQESMFHPGVGTIGSSSTFQHHRLALAT